MGVGMSLKPKIKVNNGEYHYFRVLRDDQKCFLNEWTQVIRCTEFNAAIYIDNFSPIFFSFINLTAPFLLICHERFYKANGITN